LFQVVPSRRDGFYLYPAGVMLFIVVISCFQLKPMFNVQCSMFNAQWSMLNGQCSMVNVQWSMFNVQCSMFNGQWNNALFRRVATASISIPQG